MDRTALRVAAYRLRATFGRRWAGYLSLVLLVGLLGGLAMGAVAAARRTQASVAVFLAHAHASDLNAFTAVLNPIAGAGSGYDPATISRIAHLAHVQHVESTAGIDVLFLGKNGLPLKGQGGSPAEAGNGLGSVDGLYFDQDRVTVTRGRMADPTRPDQFMLSAQGAAALGLHVGDVVPVGIYTNAQTLSPEFGTAMLPPTRVIQEELVGIAAFDSTLVEDDADASTNPMNLFTPALTRSLLSCCVNYTGTGIKVEGGSRNVGRVGAEIERALPGGFPPPLATSVIEAKAERAIRPLALALGVFGGIVALAALLVAGQAIGRQLRLDAGDLQTVRALGGGPAVTSVAGLLGVVGAAATGSLLAVAVALALSPLAPLGPVRPVYPDPGVAFDWTVLGPGAVVLMVGLTGWALVVSYRGGPYRAEASDRHRTGRRSGVAGAVSTSGLPVPAVVGVRFALEPGSGAESVPVRSAILGAVLAVAVIVATVTFGASLDGLVSRPSLYGWNWDYALIAGGGSGNLPQPLAGRLLGHEHGVAAWSGVYFATLRIDGQAVPVLGARPGTAVEPPLLSGHGLAGPSQVVLGAATLAKLHKGLGETVTVSSGVGPSTRLRIVGTATMPAIGVGSEVHLEMGTGALLSSDLIPLVDKNPFNDPVTGPNAILVRLRGGEARAPARRALERIATATSNTSNFGVAAVPVQRPAEIVNYRSLGTTPAVLGGALAVGAASALWLTLVASVRRRRRDMALLKTLGLSRGQLAAAVAWQSSVAAAVGTALGIPLGIAAGRYLWDLFAHTIDAVPAPSVPARPIVLIAVGAMALANLVAALPGRAAARTPAGLALRAE